MEQEEMVSEVKQEVAVVDNKKISDGLIAFDTRKAELLELKNNAAGLKIDNIEDKEAIAKVDVWRKKLKKARIEIENEGKTMRDQLTAISRKISAKEDELVAIIQPTEKELKSKQDWVEQEKENIRLAAAKKEQDRIQARIDRLSSYGFAIDINTLTGIDDAQFEMVCDNAKVQYDIGEAKKIEDKRIADEAAAQVLKDREELAALRLEQKKAQDIIDAEAERVRLAKVKEEQDADRLKKEAEDFILKTRIEQLNDIAWDGRRAMDKFGDHLTIATREDLIAIDDDAFAAIRDKHNADNEATIQANKLKEEKRLEKIRQDAADKALADKKIKDDEDARIEAERIAQASDKEKFSTIVSQIEAMSYPEMKSAKHKKLLAEVKDLQAKVISHIKSKS